MPKTAAAFKVRKNTKVPYSSMKPKQYAYATLNVPVAEYGKFKKLCASKGTKPSEVIKSFVSAVLSKTIVIEAKKTSFLTK